MYATKRRQRNFKRVREPPSSKPGATSNPSKRHRERLNGELETVANLLPFDSTIIDRLDKLSVLRLAVSFLQIKAHFQICATTCAMQGVCVSHPYSGFPIPMGIVPTIVDPISGSSMVDPMEANFTPMALKALGGFIMILSENGEIYYVSENIESYLGFLQSDILHQPIYEMIHSEDREEIRQSLSLRQHHANVDATDTDRVLVARFRCLLDNTCGFTRVEIRGKFMALHSTQSQSCTPINLFENRTYALAAICTPFVPPIQIDQPVEDPILKTKHSLDLSYLCLDNRLKQMLELDDSTKSGGLSFYKFLHPNDGKYVAEAHIAVIQSSSSALMVYRMVSVVTGTTYYFQSSLRLFFKNSKAESIGATHRQLSEVDGLSLLEKRDSMKSKYLSFDDSSLQSPQNVTSTATLQVARPTKESLIPRTPEVRSRHHTPRPENSATLDPNQLSIPPRNQFNVKQNAAPRIDKQHSNLPLSDQYLVQNSNHRITFPFPQDFSCFPTVFPSYLPPTTEMVDPRWMNSTKRPDYPHEASYYPTIQNLDAGFPAFTDYGPCTSNSAPWLATSSHGHFVTPPIHPENWDFAQATYPHPYKKEFASSIFNHGTSLAYAVAAAANNVPPAAIQNGHLEHNGTIETSNSKLNSTTTSGMTFISEVANTLFG
uniref:Uncharacterized protein n=1 Tax=Acrobeloides nanus TaxID=290746 RepID=A0A914D4X3_9BILA